MPEVSHRFVLISSRRLHATAQKQQILITTELNFKNDPSIKKPCSIRQNYFGSKEFQQKSFEQTVALTNCL
jgi:hypothetical protein